MTLGGGLRKQIFGMAMTEVRDPRFSSKRSANVESGHRFPDPLCFISFHCAVLDTLYYTVRHCSELYCTVSFCIAFDCIELYLLCYVALFCIVFYCIAFYFIELHWVVVDKIYPQESLFTKGLFIRISRGILTSHPPNNSCL